MYKIVAVLLALVPPLAASAQKNMVKAIDRFLNGKHIDKYITSTVVNSFGEDKLSTYREYNFTLGYDRKEIDKLCKAFYKDRHCAYLVVIKKAGEKSNEIVKVPFGERSKYGPGMTKTLTLGDNKKCNYLIMMVRDANNDKCRTCYAIVWNKGDDKKYHGRLFVVYGYDPTMPGKASGGPRGARP